jgi:hypothetical protein
VQFQKRTLHNVIQVLQKEEDRSFPFVPGAELDSNVDKSGPDEERIFHSISVDMSPYCISDSNEAKKKCSRAILDQLQSDGFALASSRNWGGKNTV